MNDNEPTNIGIQIGASPAAIEAAHRAIQAILDSPRDEETVRTALRAFHRVAEVRGASVTGSTITMPRAGEADAA